MGLLLASCALSFPAAAVEFQWGDIEGSFNSQLSLGASWRLEGQEPRLVTPGNLPGLGTASTSTADDGDANFNDGDVYSLILKAVHDLELQKGDFGLFVTRLPDIEPDDSGQFGGPLRYFAKQLARCEFGVYYMNYHRRTPYLGGYTSSIPGLGGPSLSRLAAGRQLGDLAQVPGRFLERLPVSFSQSILVSAASPAWQGPL